MHEPSDGVAEEVERQLQLALAAAPIAARRAIATRQQATEQARRHCAQASQALKAKLDAERLLATAHLRPVLDPGWWESAAPQDVAEMWLQANAWRELDPAASTPTVFDHAAGRIRQELRERTGLDPNQILALAAIQELEYDHDATLAEPPGPGAELQITGADRPPPRGFDDPVRRDQLRARLVSAGVPDQAIEARTLADLGQAREATEAIQTPTAAESGRPAPPGRGADRLLKRRR